MPSKGRAHFDTYTEQNRVKHAILTKYLAAYLKALGGSVDAFHYIDGFAGAGTYASDHAGSPLYALEILASQPKAATASFVESDRVSFEKLEQQVARCPASRELIEPPALRFAQFTECIDELLARPILKRFRRVGTFAFVDPCGLTGLYVSDLAKILCMPFWECLVLLNYDGLNRWLGGVSAGTHSREKLERFFGSPEAAEEALACASRDIGSTREGRLLDIYLRAVRQKSGAKFVLPFRFRAGTRERTGHYLIHLSQHSLAFKIMKEVMRSESSATDDLGYFEFIPPEELDEQGELFRPNAEAARAAILEELRHGARTVGHFAEEWPRRPNDMFVTKDYKQLLLAFERDGVIEVVDAVTGKTVPAASRVKRASMATLGDGYLIRRRAPRE